MEYTYARVRIIIRARNILRAAPFEIVPQNRRTDNRPPIPSFRETGAEARAPEAAPSIAERGFRYFPAARGGQPRPGMAKLATFSLASATMQPGLGALVRARIHRQASDLPIYMCHRRWIIMCERFSTIGGGCRCSSSAIRPIVPLAVLSARTFVARQPRVRTYIHSRVRARARKHTYIHVRSPIHPRPPRRKSHRINVRDQRLSISYRAFLSISAVAYNGGDSKAADYEINARLATLERALAPARARARL